MGLRKFWRRFTGYLRKLMVSLYARDLEKGGWLRRYGFPVSIFYFLNILALYIALYHQFVLARYFPHFVLAFFCVQLALGTIMVVSLMRSLGKLTLLLVAIPAAVAVLAFWSSRYL